MKRYWTFVQILCLLLLTQAWADFQPSYYVREPESTELESSLGEQELHSQLVNLTKIVAALGKHIEPGQLLAVDLDPDAIAAVLQSKQQSLESLRDALAHSEPGSELQRRLLATLCQVLGHIFSTSQPIDRNAARMTQQTKQVGQSGVWLAAILSVLFLTGTLLRRYTLPEPLTEISPLPLPSNEGSQSVTTADDTKGQDSTASTSSSAQATTSTSPAATPSPSSSQHASSEPVTRTPNSLGVIPESSDDETSSQLNTSENAQELHSTSNLQQPRTLIEVSASQPIVQSPTQTTPDPTSTPRKRKPLSRTRSRSRTQNMSPIIIGDLSYHQATDPAHATSSPRYAYETYILRVGVFAVLVFIAYVFYIAVQNEARDRHDTERLNLEADLQVSACEEWQRLEKAPQMSRVFESVLQTVAPSLSKQGRCLQQRRAEEKLGRMYRGETTDKSYYFVAASSVIAQAFASFGKTLLNVFGYLDALKLAVSSSFLAIPAALYTLLFMSALAFFWPLLSGLLRRRPTPIPNQPMYVQYPQRIPALAMPALNRPMLASPKPQQ